VIVGIDQIGREAARRAARDELQDRRYDDAQPPLLVRVVGRLIRELLELLARASQGVPGGRAGLLLLLALLGLLVAVVFVKLGRPGRGSGGQPVFAVGRTLTAAEHRALAEQAAARGEWAEAVRERLRAVVRELEARGVLERRPGRTAGEVARDGGAALPALAEDLRRGATVFDEVWYGGRTADASSYATLVAVDTAVSGSRLVTA
jgi:hypothetical protein